MPTIWTIRLVGKIEKSSSTTVCIIQLSMPKSLLELFNLLMILLFIIHLINSFN